MNRDVVSNRRGDRSTALRTQIELPDKLTLQGQSVAAQLLDADFNIPGPFGEDFELSTLESYRGAIGVGLRRRLHDRRCGVGGGRSRDTASPNSRYPVE